MEEWIYRDIDFSNCKSSDDLHRVLKTELELPDFYGKNLYALWDSITGIMAVPAYVTIRGVGSVPQVIRGIVDDMIIEFKRAEAIYGFVKVTVIE